MSDIRWFRVAGTLWGLHPVTTIRFAPKPAQ